ncbi:hypothetical protein SLA2020_287660 [Shorea laevis]
MHACNISSGHSTVRSKFKTCEVTATVDANLDKIIDINYYPFESARKSNFRHKCIGIGFRVSLKPSSYSACHSLLWRPNS